MRKGRLSKAGSVPRQGSVERLDREEAGGVVARRHVKERLVGREEIGGLVLEGPEALGGGVAVFAQVSEEDCAEAVACVLLKEVGCFRVGEVTAGTADATFEPLRIAGRSGEQIGIVVALQDDGVEVRDAAIQTVECVAEIGEDPQSHSAGADKEGDGFVCVVGRGDDLDIESGKAQALFAQAAGRIGAPHDRGCCVVGSRGHEEGQAVLAGDDAGALDMVAVRMGYDNALQTGWIEAMAAQGFGDAFAADPGIYEERASRAVDDDGIAGTAAGQSTEAHGGVLDSSVHDVDWEGESERK